MALKSTVLVNIPLTTKKFYLSQNNLFRTPFRLNQHRSEVFCKHIAAKNQPNIQDRRQNKRFRSRLLELVKARFHA